MAATMSTYVVQLLLALTDHGVNALTHVAMNRLWCDYGVNIWTHVDKVYISLVKAGEKMKESKVSKGWNKQS